MSVTGSHFGMPVDVQRDASPKAPTVGKAIHGSLNCGMIAMDGGNACERQDAGVVHAKKCG